jgi:CRISPR-associated protein Cst1
MLKYTGHPLVDVGAAAIAAFARKPLASITEADLDKMVAFIEHNYQKDPLKSFLGVAFTTNAWFNQPSFDKMPEKRTEYGNRILRGYRAGTPQLSQRCVFTGNPAVAVSFSDKLPAGRAFRQHVPMLTGEGVINFHPWGDAGLPISGEALLCIQAFPLGCAKCGGKLLAVHSDNFDLMEAFAAEFLRFNLSLLALAQQQGSKKMPEAKASARTLLIDTLLKIEMERREKLEECLPCSVTAYHLTNSGQSNALDTRNPPLEIYHMPLELTEFLSLTVSPNYRAEWEVITQRAWRLVQPARKGKKAVEGEPEEDTRPRRNMLYEDLFRLPGNARVFVRRYFLRIPVRSRFADDPRRGYSLKDEARLVSWKLTALFLRKVVNMNQERIDEIRKLGDRLAAYVNGENDRRFFTTFYAEQRNYTVLRNALIRANITHVRRGNPPLITLDPYITVFEEGDEVARPDWRLARDLVLIRMVEQLYQLGWIGKNPDAIPEVPDEETEAA